MAAAGPNPQETFIRQTTGALVGAFQNMLRGYPDVGSTVEGFCRYDFLGYTDLSTPMDIQNIFGPAFERKAQPSLLFALQELKNDDEIDKTKVHATLLHKYCGIDLDEEDPSVVSPHEVNAYLARASQEASDYLLHLYFLQPFKLYGMTETDRKYEGDDRNVSLREWRWNATGCDSAPLFRKILQVFILSEILQDYVENNADFHDPRVAVIQDRLRALRTELCATISADLIALRDELSQVIAGAVEGNAAGLLGGRLARELDRGFPNMMNVASLYPLGRLLLGQSRQEAHHLIAQNQGASSSLSYIGYWLSSHLNFSTSLFWLGVVITNYRTIWRRLKNYVTGREHHFSELLRGGWMIIPNAIILVSAPLLMIFPWIYGITSLPFTLVRSLCLHGPFSTLKHFWILKCLDVIELIKDSVLFFVYAVPFLPLIFGVVNGLLPSALLTVGSMVMFIGLTVITVLIIRDLNGDLLQDGDLLQGLSALSSTHYFSFMGVVISIGFTSFLAMGVMARQIALNASNNMRNRLREGVSLIERFAEKIGVFFHPNVDVAVNMDAVIPEGTEPAITFPAAPVQVVIQHSAHTVLLQRLQNALNLSLEEKDRLKGQENLGDYLFTPAEAAQIRELMAAENAIFQMDRQVTRVFGAMPLQNIYIPSQRALSALRDANQLETLPEATRNKCCRILALRQAMTPN